MGRFFVFTRNALTIKRLRRGVKHLFQPSVKRRDLTVLQKNQSWVFHELIIYVKKNKITKIVNKNLPDLSFSWYQHPHQKILVSCWYSCDWAYMYLVPDQYQILQYHKPLLNNGNWWMTVGWLCQMFSHWKKKKQPLIILSAGIGSSLAKQKYMSAYFLADESIAIMCNGANWYSIHVCLLCDVAFGISRLNLQPKSLQDKEVDSPWQTVDPPPHASCSSFSPLLSSPVHTPPPLSLSRFSPSLFLCEESREERQIRLLPQKLPITAWQRVQHCCLANAEFVNPGSTPANVGAPFCSCRFKWVERRAAATYRHNSGISHELRGGYSWFFFFHWNEWDQTESICDSGAHLIWTVLHFLSTCTYKVCMLIWSLEWWIFSTENSLQ